MKKFTMTPDEALRVINVTEGLDFIASFVPDGVNVTIYLENDMVTVDLTDEHDNPIKLQGECTIKDRLLATITAAQEYTQV